MRYSRVLVLAATSAIVAGAGASTAPALAGEPPATAGGSPSAAGVLRSSAAAEKSLRGASDAPVTLEKDRLGQTRSAIADPRHPFKRAKALAKAATPGAAARAFLAEHAEALSLAGRVDGLKAVRTDKTRTGAQVTRFEQQVGGVPVIAGGAVVATNPSGDVLSVTSETTATGGVPAAPRITSARAIVAGKAAVAAQQKTTVAKLGGTATLRVFDPAIVGAPGPRGARQVWAVEVSEPNAHHDEVLVDAQLGVVLFAYEKDAEALSRRVCDYNNPRLPAGADPVCTSANTARSEGGAPRNNVDIDRAYDYSGATYNFYSQNFGRDSIDGNGMELKSSVRVCLANDDCPYPNAFWDGTKMVYGQGFAAADDVVGHELTHGVTERTSGLFYAYQSGAINESISDIMGEFVDQTYSPAGTKDGPQYNWLLGEDLPIAAIRDMANPGSYGQPDSMVSSLYFGETRDADDTTFPVDNGGVHYNSGVGNKAAYLMTAGGTFRNVTVTGLGIPKVAQVWYLTDQLLSSGADYADLAVTLDNACQQLAAKGTASITDTDCQQVRNATDAVAMSTPPTNPNASATDPAVCPAGTGQWSLFSDDFESGSSKWDTTVSASDRAGSPPAGWEVAPAYAHSGKSSAIGQTYLYESSQSRRSDNYLSQHSGVTLPAGRPSFLYFEHSHLFDFGGSTVRDWGMLEYSANDGPWQDAKSLFVANPPNGGSQFQRDSHGFVGSKLDLTSLAGRTVRFRFHIAGDGLNSSLWAVDDVSVYTCGAALTGPLRDFKVSVTNIDGVASGQLSWTRPVVDGPSPFTSYQVVSTPPSALDGNYPEGPLPGPRAASFDPKTTYSVTITPMSGDVAGTPVTKLVKPTATALSTLVGANGWLTVRGVVYIGKVPAKPSQGTQVATNGKVRIYGRAKGSSNAWTVITDATVGSTGSYAYEFHPATAFEYYARYYTGDGFNWSQSNVAT
ncbi:MAG: bacillolysin [Cryptosporangiaceae bacterium]|nr:bacillolysin [Cryptosporangiaceae bacterium]